MNRFVRTAPTRRLVGVLLGICVLIAAGSTLAVAASSGGPVPPAQPLAGAIHQGLAAPPVNGISADITFKNNLIDSSELQGSDPLLSGGSGRLWLSANHQFRLELQTTDGGRADAQIVVNRQQFWAYDPSSNTVYRGSLPAGTAHRSARGGHKEAVPTVAQIQTELKRVMQHANLSGAIPSDVAGQPTYTVRVTPKDSGGLIGGAELAWDAARGVPLRVALFARGDATPVLELEATNVSYGPQPASVFSLSPPSDAKVVNVDTRRVTASRPTKHPGKRHRGRRQEVTGVAAVAGHLPFSLDAPASLAGLPRQSVSLVGASKHPAALIVYGQGLGSMVVVERAAGPSRGAGQSTSGNQGGDRQGLTLPTLSVNGTTATELDTAIGTLVRFTRGGVSYIVAGSVTRQVADSAARGL